MPSTLGILENIISDALILEQSITDRKNWLAKRFFDTPLDEVKKETAMLVLLEHRQINKLANIIKVEV